MKVQRDKLDSAIKDLLATSTGKLVGLSQIPAGADSQADDTGYYILYQSPSPGPTADEGSYADPEDCRYLDYQVKSVGRSHRQCAWMSSAAQDALTTVAAGGSGYVTPLAVTGLAVFARKTVSLGAIRRSQGENLFEVDDIYRLAVTNG